jgi:hypothetical protein
MFNNGVMISPPIHLGTGVPELVPVVVLGEGKGSYCLSRSQYWEDENQLCKMGLGVAYLTVGSVASISPSRISCAFIGKYERRYSPETVDRPRIRRQ